MFVKRLPVEMRCQLLPYGYVKFAVARVKGTSAGKPS